MIFVFPISVRLPPPPPSLSPYNRTCPDTLTTNRRVFSWSPRSPSLPRFALNPGILPDPQRLTASGTCPPHYSDDITVSGSGSSQIPGQVTVRRGYRGYEPWDHLLAYLNRYKQF